jgi:hypothetical protein
MESCHFADGHVASQALSRRRFLLESGLGFGGLALAAMLQREGLAGAAAEESGWRPPDGPPHFPPRAKNVIWIFLRGGLSHLESFDPKPALHKYGGQTIAETPFKDVQDPEKLKKVRVVVASLDTQRNILFEPQVGFRRYGQSGIEVSDWFPHIGSCVDDLTLVRSMWTTDDNHSAQFEFHTARHSLDGRFPTIGAWVTYGLGSLSDNLPQFISLGPGKSAYGGDGIYLGRAYDSVPLEVASGSPLPYAQPELDLSRTEQQMKFSLIERLNRIAARKFPDDKNLEARLKSYELAFRMQTAVPAAVEFSDETAETQQLYGLNDKKTDVLGRQLLASRRFVERGVRFVQIMHGDGGAVGSWDSHKNLKQFHSQLAGQVDKPIAGLLKDLKRRGLLNETIVVLGSEFGRTPGAQDGDEKGRGLGRDHHPFGFSVVLAGGGIKGGLVHGATDEIGFHAVEQPHYVSDIHATLFKQLGLDPARLEVPGHKRLEMELGHPIDEIIA